MEQGAYWRKRADELEQAAQERGEALSKEIFRDYQQTARGMREKVNDFYARYAGEQGLTQEESGRMMNPRELKEISGGAAGMTRLQGRGGQ